MNPKVEIRIDPEFEALIPPLSDDEFKQLRENILEANEVYDPLITWNGVLVDGHNRWKIIRENPGIAYKVTDVLFLNRNEAILWIINNQLGRRNLNKADAITLGQRKAEITAQAAKEKQVEAAKRNIEAYNSKTSSVKNDKTGEAPISTRKEVARLAGVSEGTVAQFEQVQKKKPELVEKIRKGEMTIGGAYREVKGTEKPNPVPTPTVEVAPLQIYTIDNLISEVNANTDGYVQFIRKVLTEKSTMLNTADNRAAVREAIEKAKTRLEELERLLK